MATLETVWRVVNIGHLRRKRAENNYSGQVDKKSAVIGRSIYRTGALRRLTVYLDEKTQIIKLLLVR